MNAATFIVAVLALGFLVAIPWAILLDRRDKDDWHLLHGPNDGCVECSDK